MKASSIDICDMLADNSSTTSSESLGLTFGENLFVGKEPAKPNICVTVFDTSSISPALNIGTKISKYEYPAVQIRVRSDNYEDGWDMAQFIADSLHGRANETWNDSFYTLVVVINGPTFLDWDENSRPRFIINLNLQRR